VNLRGRSYHLDHLCCRLQSLGEEQAAQIVELALSLPLLALFVVGIMDFGSAVVLKQKLDMTVEHAARVAVNQTYLDVTNPFPKSTEAIRSAVVADLRSMKVDDCGLRTAVPNKTELSWTYSGGGCSGTFSLVINRGSVYQNAGASPEWIEATRLTLSYPYTWSFGRVSRLVAPSANFVGPTQLTVEAIGTSLN
jgi:Flp pilus assembly protein TadG